MSNGAGRCAGRALLRAIPDTPRILISLVKFYLHPSPGAVGPTFERLADDFWIPLRLAFGRVPVIVQDERARKFVGVVVGSGAEVFSLRVLPALLSAVGQVQNI